MSQLHKNQIKLLKYLEGIQDFDGISLWDIAREAELNNAQTVKHHLSQLEKLGYLRRDLKNSSFEILKSPIEDIAYINLLGFAVCGNSGEFFSEENLEDKIAVSTKLLGISNLQDTFAVKAKGDSMLPEVLDNDLVIFQKQDDIGNADIGLVIDNGEPKIKQVIKNKNEIILRSYNKSYPDKIITKKDLCVLGLAKKIIHSI
ncbi:MAG: S24 family peptidase [Candidatus Paceibacterota bacterium]